MGKIADSIRDFFRSLAPVQRGGWLNPLAEPTPQIQGMDVDKLAAIIRGAQAGDTRDLFALYRDIMSADGHIQAEFQKRKTAVMGDVPSVKAADKGNPDDVAAADFIREQIEDCPSFFDACTSLLDSTLWPVAVVEKVFRPNYVTGRYDLAELVPVPAHLLDWTTGHLRIAKTNEQGYRLSEYIEPTPERYIVHRGHLLTQVPDHWGGPMRSILFWWLLSAMDRDWWARFLDRYGSPFLIGRYDTGDDTSRATLARAFSFATKIGGLVVSKDTEVELQQAAASTTGDAYEKFLAVCQREKSKLIVGQTLSSDSQPLGLGGGASELQGEVRDDIRKLDGLLLSRTVRNQLVAQLLQINGFRGRPPKVLWSAEESEEAAELGKLLESLSKAGLGPADSALAAISERLGFEVVRQAAPAPTPPPLPGLPGRGTPFSMRLPSRVEQADLALEAISARGAAELARAFRGALAPVGRIILESASAEECEQRVREFLFFGGYQVGRAADVLEAALVAHAANGAVVHVPDPQ